jgi:hypothetical protein
MGCIRSLLGALFGASAGLRKTTKENQIKKQEAELAAESRSKNANCRKHTKKHICSD